MTIDPFWQYMKKALEVFKDYYQYEEIEGAKSEKDRKNTGGCIQGGYRKCIDSQSVGCGVTDKSIDV